MTQTEFATALAAAIPATEAEPVSHRPYFWPQGRLIRLKVRPPFASTALPVLDPIGLIWYDRTGEFRTVLESPAAGKALGLKEDDLLAVLDASDKTDLDPLAATWRALITGVLEAQFSPPGAEPAVR